MGSESDCLFGQLDRILWISDSEAGVKVEKTGGVAEGEGRVASKGQTEFRYFIGEEGQAVACAPAAATSCLRRLFISCNSQRRQNMLIFQWPWICLSSETRGRHSSVCRSLEAEAMSAIKTEQNSINFIELLLPNVSTGVRY